jgi:PKD repeat protein
MISTRVLTALLLIAALVVVASPTAAQYMFLDTNGDGFRTSADHLLAGSQTVNVYLDTNHNRDGSLALCNRDGSSPLNISSYVVNLSGTNVTYAGFTNDMGAAFSANFGEINAGDGKYKNGFGAQTALPAGLYKLAHLTVTATGGALVNVVDLIPASSDFTSFGTSCIGNDFDNTYKLAGPNGGSDWTDVDGLGPTEIGSPPPVLNPIGNKTAQEQILLTFTATAVMSSGGLATFSLSGPVPPGASITSGGVFRWTPAESQGGRDWSVTICVTESTTGLQDCETITITVPEDNLAPVLSPIGNKDVCVGHLLAFTAIATDPDIPANALTFSLDQGAPVGASITPGGAFSWTPSIFGVFQVTVRVTDDGTPPLSDSEALVISVSQFGCTGLPSIQPISDMTVNEGDVAEQTVLGSDTANLALTFGKGSGPLFMTVATTSPTTGKILLTPGFADAGAYTATVYATNGTFTAASNFQITVVNVCRPPVADAGGPYAGVTGSPVALNGAGSADPDGDALTYAWSFGDGNTGSGVAPIHVYAASGTYTVSLQVIDGCGSDTDVTTATISDCLPAYFEGTGNKFVTFDLNSGKPTGCIQLEPVLGSFAIEEVDLASIVMRSPNSGSIGEIHAVATKNALGGDRNNNFVEEITVCFAKEDLRLLFSNVTATNGVDVTLEGRLVNGARFCANETVNVRAARGGGNLVATISPNPLNPSAVLTFSTQERGPVLVQLFDVRGRLVRTLRDESDAAAGYHDVRIDGTDSNGTRLSSGVYYVRIRAGAEEERKAITILK